MRGRIDRGHWNLGIGYHFVRIEHAELEARGEDVAQRLVDVLLRQEALLEGTGQGVVLAAAVEVAACFHGERGGFLGRGHQLVRHPDVADRVTIGHHVAGESPALSQRLCQQERARRGGLSVHAIVGAHDGAHPAFADGRFKVGQIAVVKVLLGRLGIEAVSERLRSAVHRKVLGAGQGLGVARIVALESLDEGDSQASGQKRIFAIRLLAASPARIADEVDVGCPEGEAVVLSVQAAADGVMIFGARLGGDGIGDLVQQRGVPHGGQADGLRKRGGGAGARHAVEAFVPVVVSRHAEPFDGRRIIEHLGGLFAQRHAPDQVVDPPFHGLRRIRVHGRILDLRHPPGAVRLLSEQLRRRDGRHNLAGSILDADGVENGVVLAALEPDGESTLREIRGIVDRPLDDTRLPEAAGPPEQVHVSGDLDLAEDDVHPALAASAADGFGDVNLNGVPAGHQSGHDGGQGRTGGLHGENIGVVRAFDLEPGGQAMKIQFAGHQDDRIAAVAARLLLGRKRKSGQRSREQQTKISHGGVGH